MLEIEPTSTKEEITLPNFITTKKEVTEDRNYRNSTLYKKINKTIEKNAEKKKV